MFIFNADQFLNSPLFYFTDQDEDSGIIEYFMKNILGIENPKKTGIDHPDEPQQVSLPATEHYHGFGSGDRTGSLPEKSRNEENRGKIDHEKEKWTITTNIRHRRSQADPAQWTNLSAVKTMSDMDDTLLLDYMNEDVFDDRPLSRVKRDDGSGIVPGLFACHHHHHCCCHHHRCCIIINIIVTIIFGDIFSVFLLSHLLSLPLSEEYTINKGSPFIYDQGCFFYLIPGVVHLFDLCLQTFLAFLTSRHRSL